MLACIQFVPSTANAQSDAETAQDEDSSVLINEKVIVTARRKDESLQDVPLSVITLDQDQLESRNVTNLLDLNTYAPNVNIGTASGGGGNISSIFIRGIGQARSASTAEPGVGTYIDGVYLGEADGALLDLIDADRVEILRGPQGTLFGKNAIGGAVNFVSVKPKDEFEGRLKLTGGSFERLDIEGFVNIPLSEDLAVRVSAAGNERGGHVTNYFDPSAPVELGNINTQAIRVQARWTPTDNLNVNFAADWSSDNNNGAPFNIIDTNPNAPRLAGSGEPAIIVSPDIYQTFLSANTFIDYEGGGAQLFIDYDFGGATLKSITAYREFTSDIGLDFDGSNAVIRDEVGSREYDQFQQELQLQGETFGDRLDYVVGAFYFNANPSDSRFQTRNTIGDQFLAFSQEIDSYALFGEANLKLTDELTLTGGLRQTWEDIALYVNFRNLREGNPSDSFDSFDYRGSLSYRPSSAVMYYATVATGFRSGGFNDRVVPDPTQPFDGLPPFQEEKAITYEAGFRSNLFDNQLLFNSTIFKTQYEDLQLPAVVGSDVFTTNVGEAEIDGLEFELIWQASDSFALNASGGFMDARITDDGGNQEISTGTQLARSPDLSYSIGAEYRNDLASGASIISRLDYGFKDDFRLAQGESNDILQESYGLLNARVTFRNADENISFSIFGTNITDEEYFRSGLDLTGGPFANAVVGVARPAEWGASLEVLF